MFGQVLYTEFLKLRRSRITWLTWLGFSIGPLVGGLFMVILKDPEAARRLGLIGQKASLSAGVADWPTSLGVLTQITAIGGMILTAIMAAYVFGREYAEANAKNMLTLPVPRPLFGLAKLVVVAVWFGVLVMLVAAEGLVVGALVGLPGFSAAVLVRGLSDIALAASATLLLVPAVAWVAVAGRGYLPPIGFAILGLVLGNVFAATGWGPWFPWSIVPLFAGIAGPRGTAIAAGSYVVLALTFAITVAGALAQMVRADVTG